MWAVHLCAAYSVFFIKERTMSISYSRKSTIEEGVDNGALSEMSISISPDYHKNGSGSHAQSTLGTQYTSASILMVRAVHHLLSMLNIPRRWLMSWRILRENCAYRQSSGVSSAEKHTLKPEIIDENKHLFGIKDQTGTQVP